MEPFVSGDAVIGFIVGIAVGWIAERVWKEFKRKDGIRKKIKKNG